MAKMTIMVGLPASGKTTRANELLVTTNAVRINKDELRKMLHNNKFTGRNEGMTRDASRILAKHFLTHETNVIIDDTNLNPSTLQSWKDLAKECEAKIAYERMDTSVEECVERDSSRENGVGEHVIKQMALQYQNYLKDMPVVVCDLDGTLADLEHRRHFVSGETKDWKGFFSKMMSDTVRKDVVDQVREMCVANGAKLIIVSARPDNYRAFTIDWLNTKIFDDEIGSLKPELVIMRNSNDSRDDTIVKSEIYDKYLKNVKVVGVFDDRPRIIRMWQEKGLNVIDVGDGVEF